MPKNKVNNNIKLKSGGGILNDATDGLSVNTQFKKTLTAGETITGATLPVAVYQATDDNKIYACDASDTTKLNFLGFAVSDGTDGNDIDVKLSGIVSGFTGLSEGLKYYIQDDKTIGTTVGTYEVLVGEAISETELFIMFGRDEYIGTETASGSGTTKTFTMPAIARTAILNIAYKANGISSYNPVFQIVLKRKGITSQTFRGVSDVNHDMKLVASLSGDTITLTASTINDGYIGTCVAYYYN